MIPLDHYLTKNKIISLALLIVLCVIPEPIVAAETQSAKIVDLEGKVEFGGLEADAGWKVAPVGQIVHAGETLRTGKHSRVSLLLADESLIKLKEDSVFTVGDVAPSAGWTLLEAKKERPASTDSQFTLNQGSAWFLNKNRDVSIVFKTPTAVIGVKGTELLVQLDSAQTMQVASLEGSASIKNAQGELVINSGEDAVTRSGAGPVKQVLLHPENAVQWVMTVPSLFTPRDLQQSGPGWNEMAQGRFVDALAVFDQVQKPEPVDLMGKVAALIVMHRFHEAENILVIARQRYPDDHLFALQQAWFDLMTGNIVRANEALISLTSSHPQNVIGWQLRALTELVLDRREEMQKAARQATTRGSDSPTSWIILSYVQQAQFQLDKAETSVRKALELEPKNVTALIALARLQFGSGYTSNALETMEKAKQIEPENAEVNNLHGFILFAMRKIDESIPAFEKAIKHDTTLAEAHMGMGLAFMRQGKTARAFEEITTAVLLDPRRSLIRSYWAKMLYQMSRYTKALDILKMARTLDPRDPTPRLYEAIILRDLNRPTEAVQAINEAIALNDNRAVYRSRFLLDGDLAVKNVDLSKLFNQLDLAALGKNKAVASVRQDYTNASGHLFYAGALADEAGRSWGRNTENLLARLLQPTNLNTFNSFNNYTSFVEKPEINVDLSFTSGNHGTVNQSAIVHGAAPEQNIAYQVGYVSNDTDGWRAGHFDRSRSVVGYMKWDTSLDGSVMLAASQTEIRQGDKFSPRYEFDDAASPRDTMESTNHRIEGGYHHNFAPGSDVLLHAASVRTPLNLRSISRLDEATLKSIDAEGATIDLNSGIQLKNDFYQFQGEYIHRSDKNQIFGGVVYYTGNEKLSNDSILEVTSPIIDNFALPHDSSDQKRSMQTVFVQDIFKINSSMILEGDIHYDRMRTGSSVNKTTWNESQWSPRLGLVFTPHKEHTLRLVGFRSLLPFISDRIDPADIAGVTVHRNGTPGSLTDEGQFVWEYETGNKLWSAGIFHADREYPEIDSTGNRVVWGSRIKGMELLHNRLLGDGFGLSARYLFENVADPQSEQSSTVNRDEHLVEAGLKWVGSSGWSTKAKESYRFLDFAAHRSNENIFITDLEAAYEFPKKLGSLKLNIDNLFDERFNWVIDPFVFQGRNPSREMFMTLNLSF